MERENTVNNSNILQTLRDFSHNCRADKRITPYAQLVYRVLIDLANRARWAFPFETSDSELKAITHIKSNDTINHCKRTLKNLGYIDYTGKPSKYTIYAPAGNGAVNKAVQSATPPDPPVINRKTKTQTERKEQARKESEGERHDNNGNANDISTTGRDPADAVDTTGGGITDEEIRDLIRGLRANP